MPLGTCQNDLEKCVTDPTNVKCTISAQVNPNIPRTFGDGIIHSSHFDAMVDCSDPLPELEIRAPTEEEESIGQFVADNLVQDGATIQMGVYL